MGQFKPLPAKPGIAPVQPAGPPATPGPAPLADPGVIMAPGVALDGPPAWAHSLRRLYHAVVEEPLPDTFLHLLAQLEDDNAR